MPLPKIQSPIFNIAVPSMGKEYPFRPFLVKEEKILLMAQQGDDDSNVSRAIKQIVNNCCLDEKLNIEDFNIVDLEYVFLKLRARSINNMVEVSYKDLEDEKIYTHQINLDEVEVVRNKEVSNKIKVNKDIVIIMTYPRASLVNNAPKFETELELFNFMLKKCIKEVYDEDSVYVMEEQEDAEIQEFIDSLDIKTFNTIREFFENAPKLEYVIQYKNSLGNDRKIILDNLLDFFTWR